MPAAAINAIFMETSIAGKNIDRSFEARKSRSRYKLNADLFGGPPNYMAFSFGDLRLDKKREIVGDAHRAFDFKSGALLGNIANNTIDPGDNSEDDCAAFQGSLARGASSLDHDCNYCARSIAYG